MENSAISFNIKNGCLFLLNILLTPQQFRTEYTIGAWNAIKERANELDPPSIEVGDKVEPLTELLVVIADHQSTQNNLSPDHAKMDPAVTEKVVLEKEAVGGGIITKDDVTMKTVIKADPPSIEVDDKVEPLTELLVVIADPQSTQNNLSPDHAKMDPAVTEKVELEKEAVDGGVITKDDATVKTVIEADPPIHRSRW